MKRIGISKSLRFKIFARDGFCCRYCGRKSDEVKLVIDHVIPVAKGGTNDEENLATSCDPCNSGKGVKDAAPTDDSDTVRLSRLQSLREQAEVAEAAVECIQAQARFQDAIVAAWCAATGRDKADKPTILTVTRYAEEFDFATVLNWIGRAATKAGNDDRRMGKYISGIRRCVLAEKEGV